MDKMKLMKEINEKNFVSYLDQLPKEKKCIHNHEDYHFWNRVDFKIETQYFKVGGINVEYTDLRFDVNQYNKEVNLNLYPYYNCDIYCCKRCKSLFFHYIERESYWSGFRMIRKEILSEGCLKISNEIYSGDLNKIFLARLWNKLFKN